MRRVLVLFFVVLLVLLPSARASGPTDARDVGNVTKILKIMETPQLAPGGSGDFVFNFSNPYVCGWKCAMQNIVLNVSIYRYATIEETVPVDGSWPWAYPRIRVNSTCDGRECLVLDGRPSARLGVNATDRYIVERLPILTSQDMPHGSVFTQSSYFLRFWLEFDFDNGTGPAAHLTMASRGYFTDDQWNAARFDPLSPPKGCTPYNATNRCLGNLNLTALGVDGVLTDSAFGVKEPIPAWPFYGLLAVTIFFLILAFLYWVEENPGRYPRVERVWLTFKGRLRRVFRLPWAKKI